MHSMFAHDVALDRQSSLIGDAGVNSKASPKLAELAASKRADEAAARPAPRARFSAGRFGLVLSTRRSPGLAGI